MRYSLRGMRATSLLVLLVLVLGESSLRFSPAHASPQANSPPVFNDNFDGVGLVIRSPRDGLATSNGTLLFSGQIFGGETLEFESAPVPFDSEGEFSHEFILIDGGHQYSVDAEFENGEERHYQIQILLDDEPPEINLNQPSNGFVTDIGTIPVQGQVSDATGVTVRVDGVSVDINQSGQFQSVATLSLGENQILVEAQDELGNQSSQTLNGIYDPDAFVAPRAPNKLLISIGYPIGGTVSVEGFPGAVESNVDVRLVNPAQEDEALSVSDAAGSFSGTILGGAGQSISIRAVSSSGAESDPINLIVPEAPPPSPESVAPELPGTPITHFADAVEFLYASDPPVQRELDPSLLDRNRVAVVQGTVRDETGAPLPGVRVEVTNNSVDYGYTVSRDDGRYDLVVNGGSEIVLEYRLQGFLQAQRTVKTEWRSYSQVAPVDLVPYDQQSTVIAAGTAELQIAQGSVEVDESGARQATLLFHPGTTAEAVLSNGATMSLEELTVRATEYSVGPNGPNRMPAQLPLVTAYTYAVELSVDEAVLQGATRVDFNQPVPLYVENFLGFPVGSPVPVGYYDDNHSSWLPSENGRVIEIVSESAGVALIDIDGDGVAENEGALLDLGITGEEAGTLADIYEVGDQLWRTPITHFTPWDCNWPYGPPEDSEDPEFDEPPAWDNPDNPPDGGNGNDNPTSPESADNYDEDVNCEDGSIIECETRVLRESLPVFGSPFNLNYRSDRVPGFAVDGNALKAAKMRVPLTGSEIPGSMKAVRARIHANGSVVDSIFDDDPQPNMVWEDASLTLADYYGRDPGGRQRVEVEVSWGYEPVFYASPAEFEASFGVSQGESEFSSDRGRDIVWRTKRWSASHANLATNDLATPNPPGLKNTLISGWTLTPHHVYDSEAGILWRGDGTRREIPSPLALSPVVNPEELGIQSAAIAPDGSIYWLSTAWSDGGQFGGGELTSTLYRTDPLGNQAVVSQSISCSDMGSSENSEQCSGDAPLAAGQWTPANAVLIDDRGQIFLALRDIYANSEIVQRLYRMAPNGDAQGLYTFREGSPWSQPSRSKRNPSSTGDSKPRAADSESCALIGVESRDGRVYFACSEYGGGPGHPTIGMIWADGSASHIAGGDVEIGEAPQPAIDAAIQRPRGLAVAEDGAVFFSTYDVIWRISPSGILERYAGSPSASGFEERAPRLEADFNGASALAIAPDGSLYVLDPGNHRVRKIDQNGLVRTIVGGGDVELDGLDTKVPAQSVRGLSWSSDAIVFAPDGALHLTEHASYLDGGSAVYRIARDVQKRQAGSNEIEVVSSDGSELYIFSDAGLHTRTVDVRTGSMIYEFEYDADFQLVSFSDVFGSEYSVSRSGASIDIVTPFEVTTSLSLNDEGYIEVLASPESRQWSMGYGPGGMLTSLIEPKGNSTEFAYGFDSKLTAHSVDGEIDWVLSEYDADGGARNVEKISGSGDETIYSSFVRGNCCSFGHIKKTWYPDGSTEIVRSQPDFSKSTTTRSGVEIETTQAADERFGFNGASLESASISQAGNTQAITISRQITAGIDDPLGEQDIVERTTVNGREYVTHYEAQSGRLSMTSPEGRTSEMRFNAYGKIDLIQVGQLSPMHLEYDSYGRLSKLTQGSGADLRSSEVHYSSEGYLAQMIDPAGRLVSWSRDSDGSSSNISLPGLGQIALVRDANDNIESLAPPEREAHGFEYDQADRLTQYAPPVAAGSMSPAQYQYDDSHRLVHYQRQDGQSIEWDYDDGNIHSVLTPGGQYYYDWRYGGRLSRVWLPSGDSTKLGWSGDLVTSIDDDISKSNVEFLYDKNFWVTSIAVDGSSLSISYDDDGLPTQAGDLSLSYNQNSALLDSTTLGFVADVWSHNVFGEPDGYSASFDTQLLLGFSYQRDKLGRIEQVFEVLGSGSPVTTEYDYDGAGRLATVRVDGTITHEYEYDANGNRILTDSVSAMYDQQDRLLSYGSWEYSYTADGELQERTDTSTGESRSFDYDVFGNLDGVVLEDGTEITYQQDGLMRRASRSVDGAVTHRWAYQDQLNPVSELDADGNVVSRFVYAWKANVPAYMVRDGQTYRIISDHLGSPRLVVNVGTGAVAQEMKYGPFGEVLLDTNPGFQPFGFAGGLYDPLTGLVRFGARDYDPQIGRWTIKDPIGFQSEVMNLYAYVSNDPVNRIDPEGQLGFFTFNAAKRPQYAVNQEDALMLSELSSSLMRATGEAHNLLYSSVPALSASGAAGSMACRAAGQFTRKNERALRGACKKGMLAGSLFCGDLQDGRLRLDPDDTLLQHQSHLRQLQQSSKRPIPVPTRVLD